MRGEVWWAETPSGDRPVLILTRNPVADRIAAVVVAACTRTVRGLTSELPLGPDDGMDEACVASLDNLHTLRKHHFRRRITTLPGHRDDELCAALDSALGCPR